MLAEDGILKQHYLNLVPLVYSQLISYITGRNLLGNVWKLNYMNRELIFKEADANDSVFIKELMTEHWGGEPLVIRGKNYYPSTLNGIMVLDNKKVIGFLFYDIQDRVCEIVVFEIFEKFQGIGTVVLEKLKVIAKNKQCNKLYLMTTNDNLEALRFYQKRGFHICGIHLDSVKVSRKMKPCIGETGDYGIPVRDEIDLEFLL